MNNSGAAKNALITVACEGRLLLLQALLNYIDFSIVAMRTSRSDIPEDSLVPVQYTPHLSGTSPVVCQYLRGNQLIFPGGGGGIGVFGNKKLLI